LDGRIAAHDVVNPETGEVLVRTNEAFTPENINLLQEKGIHEVELLLLDLPGVSASIRNTMLLDKVITTNDAVLDIYRKLRPTSPATLEMAEGYFNTLFLIIHHMTFQM